MQGLHLTADLYNCRCDPVWLLDAEKLGAWCLKAVGASGLQAVNQLFHTFPATEKAPAVSRPPYCWLNPTSAFTLGRSKKP